MDPAAIVFDLDGVLVDSEQVWDEVRRGIVTDRGGRWRDEATRAMQGMSTPEWSAYLSRDLGVGRPPEVVAAEVLERMAERYGQRPPLLPGAVAAVERLAERWPLGLASSSSRQLIELVLAASGLAGCFRVTVSTEEVPRGKPAPDAYLEVAARLGVDPADCAAVEDSSNGVRSAVAAGMRVIAIPARRYPLDDDAARAAAVVLGGLDELTVATVEALA